MFTLLFRKMRKTYRMVLCIFIGFLMAAGMMSTVPIYMDASLQRTLLKDMEAYQKRTGEFPGIYSVRREFAQSLPAKERVAAVDTLSADVKSRVDYLPVPVASSKTIVSDNLRFIEVGGVRGTVNQRVKFTGMTGIAEHVTITAGRMFTDGGIGADGTVEVIATENAMKELGITRDGVYTITGSDTGSGAVTVTVVGTFVPSDENDVYWSEGLSAYTGTLITDHDAMCGTLTNSGIVLPTAVDIRYVLDYRKMDMNDIGFTVTAIGEDNDYYPGIGCKFSMDVQSIWRGYAKEAEKLTRILWVLQIPTMVMLAFYLFMVSKLSVEQEKNEIAVFRSRGASSAQIFGMYALETGLLGLAALILAPFIGLAMCRFLGVSDGFLEFVNRTGISAKITPGAVLYSLAAVALFFCATMIPIIPASRLSVVEYKQSRTKVVKMALWEKLGVDIILTAAAVAFYMIYTGNEQSPETSTGDIDPMFFIFAACLIFGLGLLFIRLYPYLLELIYRTLKPLWPPAQYMAITTVCRSQGGRERFLMLFLVVTFSLGIFSANTARTINDRKSDRISYSAGADIVIKEYWQEATAADGSAVSGYVERGFERFETLEGVEIATKVMVNKKAKVTTAGVNEDNVTVMAVEPYKFANTAWFRNDLLPVHWWNYVKALQDLPSGTIISRALADKHDIRPGDTIEIRWSGNDKISAPVLAVADYWPGINPNVSAAPSKGKAKAKAAETSDEEEQEETITSYAVNCFCIMNYYYVNTVTDLEPYEVWIKLKDGASSEALYNDIKAKRLPIESITDTSQLLIAEKNKPQLQGMNGSLTLSFVVIMTMTVIGFLIYWILSIKSRTLQFGILRAMGMTFREMVGMIGCEQLLVSGVSLAVSFIIGGIASDLFVPLFRSMYSPADRVPPFIVAASQSDYVKLYILIVVMLGGGFAVLGALIKKLNINKALKLGED